MINYILVGFIIGLFAGLYLNISKIINGVRFKITVNGLKGKIRVVSSAHKKALLTVTEKETEADIQQKQKDEIYDNTLKRFEKEHAPNSIKTKKRNI
jgi:hypothetical protein